MVSLMLQPFHPPNQALTLSSGCSRGVCGGRCLPSVQWASWLWELLYSEQSMEASLTFCRAEWLSRRTLFRTRNGETCTGSDNIHLLWPHLQPGGSDLLLTCCREEDPDKENASYQQKLQASQQALDPDFLDLLPGKAQP